MSHEFGAELRRRRVHAEVSLSELAKRLNFSKGYLSKIETGRQSPTEQLARLADAALGADGDLAALVGQAEHNGHNVYSPDHAEAVHASRREVLAFGSALFLPLGISDGDAETAGEDPQTRLYYRDQFEQLRRRGQQSAPGLVLRTVGVEYCTLLELAAAAQDPPTRAAFEILAARYAEFAGWMAQEAGDNQAALAWTRQSANLATGAGDTALAAYTLVREAELAMYAHDALRTISLAQQAQAQRGADKRVRALAAHREAQGHAMLNNGNDCQSALDRAQTLLATGTGDGPGGSPLGSTSVADLNLAVSGWCTYDLGRPRQAAEQLERALSQTAPTARRARAMYGARLALAYEATSDLDRMCEVAAQVIDIAQPIGSSTARTELRRLTRAMARRHNYRPAKQLHVEITAALFGFPVS
ncbi:helix-turn-helix domain-containing protein [Kibdelosporangium phytohabitans]|uniref:helix-turn-helix domain-containing protein n=1 Tax=Kibdelosporangium phytohabitans TaxID=860235 RepID=UPI000A5F198D|nr:helix-turn-helix transcriptional regulator [Kibdelosporangium phytohabitans]MBE1461271.1 transcriptional regulator with XRE-family HTH domain [Kibdelosporangium phytohabitans]